MGCGGRRGFELAEGVSSIAGSVVGGLAGRELVGLNRGCKGFAKGGSFEGLSAQTRFLGCEYCGAVIALIVVHRRAAETKGSAGSAFSFGLG